MNEGQFLWLAVLTIGQVIGIASNVVAMRRKPPISEELYKDFLSKADHERTCQATHTRINALDQHNTDTHKAIFETIKENQKTIQDDFRALERGLGRVEGMLKRATGDTE